MYVCVCKAVTESQVRQAIKEGCCNRARLRRELGVGTVCGKCTPMVKRMLSEEKK